MTWPSLALAITSHLFCPTCVACVDVGVIARTAGWSDNDDARVVRELVSRARASWAIGRAVTASSMTATREIGNDDTGFLQWFDGFLDFGRGRMDSS